MGDLFDDYVLAIPFGQVAWDEMFEAPGVPRPAARSRFEVLQATPPEDFESLGSTRDRAFRDRGVTFQLSGEERPFPLDLVPRVIAPEDWATRSAGSSNG